MLNFNFTYAPGTTLQQMVGMEMAGRLWSSYLKDPVTINIHVGVVKSSSLPANVIGGALPGVRAAQQISAVRDRLVAEAGNLSYSAAIEGTSDGRSFDDKVAATHLTGDIALSTWLDVQVTAGTSTWLSSRTIEASVLNVTRANAKAMGLSLTDSSNLDGYILFSDLAGARTSSGQAISWNYNYTGTPSSSQLDFLSTAVHEIGHILGFVSGVDRPGWMTNKIDSSQETSFWSNATQQVRHVTPLDLFRFSNTANNEISYGVLAGAGNALGRYFSVDNGYTKLADFSTGMDTARGGDGSQASHWKQGISSIMAPKLRLGTRAQISGIDLRAMDVIGWDLQTTTAMSSSPTLGITAWDQLRMVERGGLNATSLANTTINFSTLQSNAINSLATRAGQSTSWITSNLTNTSVSLPTGLRRDRTIDVAAMVVNSQVYNWGNESGDGSWQQILNLYRSESLFSMVDELELAGFDVASEQIVIDWNEIMISADAGGGASWFQPIQDLNSLPVPLVTLGVDEVKSVDIKAWVPTRFEIQITPQNGNATAWVSIDFHDVKPQVLETLLWESSVPKTLRKVQANSVKPEEFQPKPDLFALEDNFLETVS